MASEQASVIGDHAVQQFMEMAQVPEEQARFLLEAAGGDADGALQLLFDQVPSTSAMPARTRAPQRADAEHAFPEHMPRRPPAPVSVAGPANGAPAVHAAPARRGGLIPTLLGTVVRIPFFLLRTSLGVVSASVSLGLGIGAYVGDRVLPAPVMRTIRGVAAAITGSDDIEPAEQAQRFIQQFKATYGDRHPEFVPMDLQQACVASRTEHRFLLVYLHSPEHQDTEQFCRTVMCDSDLVAYANAQFVSWGGDIRQSDAHGLSMRLGATTYPFIAVLSMAHSNKATLIKAAQGSSLLVPGTLQHLLQQCVEEQGALLVAQRAEINERETTRRLLAEQNDEFEASLAADRQREQQREEERREQERREKEAEEQAAKARAAAEAQEQRARDRATALVTRRQEKLRLLSPEAEAGGAVPGTAVVRVRLPDGSNAQRCFPPGCTIASLFDFVDSLDSTNYWRYSLVSNYPRKVFTQDADQAAVTLADAGLVPHAALFVQPLDEEEIDQA